MGVKSDRAAYVFQLTRD